MACPVCQGGSDGEPLCEPYTAGTSELLQHLAQIRRRPR